MRSTDALPETIGSIPTVPIWKPAPESLWVRLDCFAQTSREIQVAALGGGDGGEGMTRAETETIFRWDREELVVHIWTADRTVMRKLDRLGVPVEEETHGQRTGELTGRFYHPIPLAAFRWGMKRAASAAQMAARARNVARAREKRSTGTELDESRGAE